MCSAHGPDALDKGRPGLLDRQVGGVDYGIGLVVGQGRIGAGRVLLVPGQRLLQHFGEIGGDALRAQLVIPALRPYLRARGQEEFAARAWENLGSDVAALENASRPPPELLLESNEDAADGWHSRDVAG